MTRLEHFLAPTAISLKICGITRHADAEQLATLGVDALGFNFWPHSKRYLPPATATWLRDLAGRLLRVGVFVNAPMDLPLRLMQEGWLDVIQLHGDETPADLEVFRAAHIPIIKSIGVNSSADLKHVPALGASAILLDAYAPGVDGGTGEVCDWNVALEFRKQHPDLPLILAGGIGSENAAHAARFVRPAALDVASGAESSPGIKDFIKVQALLDAVNAVNAETLKC